jgi:plasmid stabilization system protein ParE
MTGYDFHPEAVLDLDEIWDFIAAGSPQAADRLIEEILASLDRLLIFPGHGHRRPDLTLRPLRFILVREYLIASRRSKSRCGCLLSCTDDAVRA